MAAKPPRVLVANHSGYPTEGADLTRPQARWDAVRAAVQAQVDAGVDIVTDGQIGHTTPLDLLIRGLNGLAPSGQTASVPSWGETELPTLQGPIRWIAPFIADDLRLATEVTDRPVKVSLAGPYTLASLALDPDGVYDSLGGRITACAQAVAAEVRALAQGGAAIIQIEEPHVLQRSGDFPRLREAFHILAEAKGSARLALMLGGDDICPLYDWLQNLPIDILGVDVPVSPGLVTMISDRVTEVVVGLGLTSPDAPAEEAAGSAAAALKAVLPSLGADEVHIQPSATLTRLGPGEARAHLERLVGVAQGFRS